ncbi:efflux RND transporter periplasmic adaptor subunit [Acidiphilium sp. AL]|uniref:Efflux RND transporter periplasmic adaptor subunit n=1 Tax=Acidiphilium iwatense TaxID=768198 RepID=A0ABS9DWA8_9PROT|nr:MULTISPECIES: efflux RND transporter periplasmic adaptor subunit [Acidiphilium]MCF3947031.1 efflux RND transporter periplasmic adaptor subunit [Acidiphilium iwatense]MCU4160293.1 efflux RND transporter periplasmic adaptor subunit [Acidiphilium sp. AL]
MKTLAAFAIFAGMIAAPALAAAGTTNGPSVLVKLTPLTHGSLPRVLTVYGSVGPASSARQTLMAPLQAAVTNVYVRRGALVAKGAPLVRLVPSPASVSAYAQAKSALRVATDLVSRTRSMVGSHLATDQQLFQAEKSQADAEAALDALQAQGAQGPHTLRAPFPAIVTVIDTTPGAIVSEGAGLVQLAQPNGLVLKAGVVPNEAREIHVKDPVKLTPIGGGASLAGTVLFHGSLVESINGLVPVDISVPAGKTLLGEMFQANITVGHINGYVVPHRAILVNDTGNTYIVQAHGMTAKKVVVHVLVSDDDKDVINGALEPGAPVVLAGNYQLDNGMKIRLADPKGKASQ